MWQLSLAETILDRLLPGHPDRSIPSARDIGLAADVVAFMDSGQTSEELEKLNNASHNRFGKAMTDLDRNELGRLLDSESILLKKLSQQLGPHILKGYFRHPAVRFGLNLPSNAPFPHGVVLPDFDFDLLESVFERGTIFRICSNG